MKVGVTVDEVRGTRYTVGRYDFYTRQLEVADDLALQLQVAEELAAISQRVLSSLYNSNGRFITPEDLEAFKCAVAKVVQATPEAKSVKKPRSAASAARLSNGSQVDSPPSE